MGVFVAIGNILHRKHNTKLTL